MPGAEAGQFEDNSLIVSRSPERRRVDVGHPTRATGTKTFNPRAGCGVRRVGLGIWDRARRRADRPPSGVFGKEITSRIDSSPARTATSLSSPEPHTAVRGRAVLERLQQMPEPHVHLFRAVPDHVEDAFLDAAIVYANTAAAEFSASCIRGRRAARGPCRGRFRESPRDPAAGRRIRGVQAPIARSHRRIRTAESR